MKKIIVGLFLLGMINVSAQIKTPQPSPKSKLEQVVGLTDVSVEYSRPGVKGRKVFGNLVPFGKLWRTGANENTKITFSEDIMIDGKTLKKGSYALYTKPNATNWEVIFYKDHNNWGNPKKWDDAKVALITSVVTQKTAMKVETFTISVDNVTNTSGVLGFSWDNTYAGVKFEVPTDKAVEKNISAVINGPSAADYYKSAEYYLDSNKDINKAKTWINKAVEMTKDKPKFWYVHKQALIYKKAGDKKSAKKSAKYSLELAKKENYKAYIKKNEDLLKTL